MANKPFDGVSRANSPMLRLPSHDRRAQKGGNPNSLMSEAIGLA